MGLYHFVGDNEKTFDFLFSSSKEDFMRSWNVTELEYKDMEIAQKLVFNYLKNPTEEMSEILDSLDIPKDTAFNNFCNDLKAEDLGILESKEYEFVDKFLTKTGLWDDGFYFIQTETPKGTTDAFYDYSEQKYMNLHEGLEALYDSAVEQEDLEKIVKLQEAYKPQKEERNEDNEKKNSKCR